MAEAIFFLALVSPVLLMIWLTAARRKARARVAEEYAEESTVDFETVEELERDEEGHVAARRHLDKGSLQEPDATGGEPAGIRAIQGRR